MFSSYTVHMLWDAHCHLHDSRITDIEDQLTEARQAGICTWIVCSTGPDDWERVRQLCHRLPNLYPAFGVHPWYLEHLPPHWEEDLFLLLRNTPSLGGECGLDFETAHPHLQESIFRTQVAIAAEQGKPLNIHCRKAWHRLLPILKPYREKIPTFIVHAFSQNLSVASSIIRYGGMVSFASHILRPWNLKKYQRLIQELPLSALLIETDAPDIPLYTPEKGLSGLSRLSHLLPIAHQICEWKNISLERLSLELEKNWQKLHL